MLNYLKNEANIGYTENGAVTNVSTGSYCLDLFGSIGAMRHISEDEIYNRFVKAYAENPDIAMKILFYARDIRGGLGERKVFRTILNRLPQINRDSVKKNIEHISEYGRFDDILSLFGTSCQKEALAYIKSQLEIDQEAMWRSEEVSLLAKWLPSVNASNSDTVKNAKLIAKYCGLTDAEYRKTLSSLRAYIKIIENNLREKDYTFEYEKQPSKALFKYREAFYRNDAKRYSQYIERVNTGEIKLNASTLYPYELVDSYISAHRHGSCFMRELSEPEKNTLNATWKSLPEYHCDGDALAIIDTSGSMYWAFNPKPASVALSLGLYFAEHNKGRFANHFIEFSEKPELIEIKGDTFAEKLRYVTSFNKVANTNLEAVFDLVLNAAVKNKVSQEEMPKRLIIISDMEFDACVRNPSKTIFKNARQSYKDAGYTLPGLVFWNVASRNNNMPVTIDDRGVVLVSGCTPRIFDMIMENNLDAYEFMMEVLGDERYAKIVA